MATSVARIEANRANARLSTGPRTEAGKATAARNRLAHGLNSNALLPHEDARDFQAFAGSVIAEWEPRTPTECFLVEEMIQAQWKLGRVRAIEREIMKIDNSNPTWGSVAEKFIAGSSTDDALLRLSRYESVARRAWYKALAQLRSLRWEQEDAALDEPVPMPPALFEPPRTPEEFDETNPPMTLRLAVEWQQHRKRDPLFHPEFDRSQMSRDLRKWFDANGRKTATAAAVNATPV